MVMLNYLQKFNELPLALRDQVSAPATMKIISELEEKFSINLAVAIIKVMVKEISLIDLGEYFVFEHGLDKQQAERLAAELKGKIFINMAEYFGLAETEIPAKDQAPIPAAEMQVPTAEANAEQWLEQKKSETAIRSSDFFFSTEDEEEVKELAKKVENYMQGEKAPDNTEKILDRIIKEINIGFSSEELANRFRQIMKTYLRGIRKKIDAREALTKPAAVGGLGFDSIFAENILSVADDINNEEKNKPAAIKELQEAGSAGGGRDAASQRPGGSAGKLKTDALKEIGARDIAYDFSGWQAGNKKKASGAPAASEKASGHQKAEQQLKFSMTAPSDKAEEAEEIAAEEEEDKVKNYSVIDLSDTKKLMSEPAVELPTDNGLAEKGSRESQPPESNGKIIFDKSTDKKEAVLPASGMAGARRSAEIVGKVKMEDVKYVPKLVGPIEELGDMDLLNFRRLNQNAGIAASRIKEKIAFLEEDSYSRRLAGIKAWRQSPVNKLYLQIGQESINAGVGLDEIIKKRQAKNLECLTKEEFTAVMDLNKALRF